MKNRTIRKILTGISFTSVLFVFQACYGTPQDFGSDILIEGIVKSKTTGIPISGAKISLKVINQSNNQFAYTNESGKFHLYTLPADSFMVNIVDTTFAFASKDTVLANKGQEIFVNIELEPTE